MVRLCAVWLLVLLVGCDRPESDALVFAVATPPAILDPRLATDAASERVNALLYDRLVSLDEQGRPQPAMADWKDVGELRYRFTLRASRATFWDGTPVRAADVAATYRSLLEPGSASPHAGALNHIAAIEVIDDARVDFELSRQDPAFPSRLTIGIVPADRADGDSLARAPAGSGAFRFDGWRDDGGVTLRRRVDGQRLAFVPVSDPTMRVLKLLRGEAQLLQNDLPVELYRYLGGRHDVELVERAGTTFAYLGFNLGDPVLADRNVRAAIAHAIDRDAIIRYLFNGRAEKAGSVLRPTHWAGAPGLSGFEHNLALAREYLARAGYGPDRPLTLSYKTSTDPFRVRIAHVFQDQLARAGIRIDIASHDWGTFFGDIKAGRFQLYSLAWVGVNTPDILRYAFHSASLPPGGANRGRYRSTRVDSLIERAQAAPADDARSAYVEAQRIVHDDIVYVPLWYEANVAAIRGAAAYGPGHDGNYLALNRIRQGDD